MSLRDFLSLTLLLLALVATVGTLLAFGVLTAEVIARFSKRREDRLTEKLLRAYPRKRSVLLDRLNAAARNHKPPNSGEL